MPAVRTAVSFLQGTVEDWIDDVGIVSVIDFHRVMIHLGATFGALNFWFVRH